MRHSQRLLYAAMFLMLFAGVPEHGRGLRASPRAEAQDPHHPDQGFAPAATPEERQRMMNQSMTKMMGETNAADAKVDALVQAMNAAKNEEKINAIAAVVAALVEERRSMHGSMVGMMNMMNMMNQMRTPAGAAPEKPEP